MKNLMKLALVLIITQFSFGNPIRFKMSESVSQFKSDLKDNKLKSHRTQKNPYGSNELRMTKDTVFEKWYNGDLDEYRIVDDKTLNGRIKNFKGHFPKLKKEGEDLGGVVLEKESMDTVQFFDFVQNKSKRKEVPLESLIESYKTKSKKYLKDFGDEVEYDNYSIRRLNGRVYKVEMLYRRIFEGGIVKDGVSFVNFTYDENGEVEKFMSRWPKFVKEPKNRSMDNSVRHTDEVFNLYEDRVFDLQEVTNETDTVFVDSTIAQSAALSWLEIDGKITPGLSVVQSSHFGNKKLTDIVDVPFIRKYGNRQK